MSDRLNLSMTYDLPPWLLVLFSWAAGLNWLLVISLVIAGFRAWVAYEEMKLKKRQEDAKDRIAQETKERGKEPDP